MARITEHTCLFFTLLLMLSTAAPDIAPITPEVLVHPKNQTVCQGEEAIFRATVRAHISSFLLNDRLDELTPVSEWDLNLQIQELGNDITKYLWDLFIHVIKPLHEVDVAEAKVQVVVLAFDGGRLGGRLVGNYSEPAYLTYKINQQYPVTGLTVRANQSAITLDWQPRESNQTTRYLLSVSEVTDNAASNSSDNGQPLWSQEETRYEFIPEPGKACGIYRFKVSAQEIRFKECNATEQFHFSPVMVSIPRNITSLQAEHNQSVVKVHWLTDDSDNNDSAAYRINLTDLITGQPLGQWHCRGCSSFNYAPEDCGDYHLNISVAPDRCHHPAFIRATPVRFHIDCPDNTTESTEAVSVEAKVEGNAATWWEILWSVIAVIFPIKSALSCSW